MELLIKIPKELEQQFKRDAFEDSLTRLSADFHLIAGIYEQKTARLLRDVFKNAVELPPHGRLIDADYMKTKIEGPIEKIRLIHEWIDTQPTILEAEESECDDK